MRQRYKYVTKKRLHVGGKFTGQPFAIQQTVERETGWFNCCVFTQWLAVVPGGLHWLYSQHRYFIFCTFGLLIATMNEVQKNTF
jgi:hypothetical protein